MSFSDFLVSLGLIPPNRLISDDKWHPCGTVAKPKSGNGRYNLSADGRSGAAQDWQTMDRPEIWREGGKTKERTQEQRSRDNAALSAKLAKGREDQWRAIVRCRAEYEGSTALLSAAHPYLARKRISAKGTNGLRVDANNNLLIPMLRGNRLVSLQRIDAEGVKKFATGCPSKLATFTIDRPGAVITILAEGFATGATVAEAVPMARVVVCFSASNMVAVAEHGEWSGSVIVAGDNDAETKEIYGTNPGEEAAQKAAAAIGCGYAIPAGNGDWNDVFVVRLEKIEEANEFKKWKPSPAAMRSIALAPIRAELLKNLRSN